MAFVNVHKFWHINLAIFRELISVFITVILVKSKNTEGSAIMCVQIYSRQMVTQLITKGNFPQNTAVISFCDCGTEPNNRVNFSGVCSQVMYIELDDLEIEDIDDYEAFFPEAKETAEFIVDNHNNGMNIICQCEYGQSRSAGCAAAIMEHFYRTGIEIFKDFNYYPNKVISHKIFDSLHTLEKSANYHT